MMEITESTDPCFLPNKSMSRVARATRPPQAIQESLDCVVVLDLVERSPVTPRQVQEPLMDRMRDVRDLAMLHPRASR